MTRRLFIFASFDKDCLIDDTVVWYLNALSALGDIIFITDCDTEPSEISKIKNIPNIIHTITGRHNEYDFGSYKRGFLWAKDKNILKNYDWVYLANDSVYGPVCPLGPIILNLEQSGCDALGMIKLHENKFDKMAKRLYIEHWREHIQSWFVGLSPAIFNSNWFANFMQGIKRQELKTDIIMKYEVGLSQLIIKHGFKLCVFEKKFTGAYIYKKPIKTLSRGMPFIKKQAMNNTNIIRKCGKFIPTELQYPFIQNIKRNEIVRKYTHLWKAKLWRITLISAKISSDKKLLIIRVFKIIPIKVYL
ncbi:MAG: rhamnan synthesis F family protein [Alphaproteobacteria bacterium]|nr:rhamnan synthesis F family protein [Alphaproteobacteria bacterium]